MHFVALDVETANADVASICQVGLALYAHGQLTEEWKSYVNPRDFFDPVNVSVHGITEAQVANAPEFSELAARIRGFLEKGVVASHTHFDHAAIDRAFERCELEHPSCVWLDTARVARRAWPEVGRSGYGLRNVCEMIGHSFAHHDALEDAKAAARVLLAAMERTGIDLDGWLDRVEQPLAGTLARVGAADGPLAGETVVFTGSLSLTRGEAADMASRAGCTVAPGLTKRTTLLVVGDQDARRLCGHEKSGKHRKAEELISKGQAIRIVRESDFLRLVSFAPITPQLIDA